MDKKILTQLKYYLGFVENFHNLHFDKGGKFCFPRSFENIALNIGRFENKPFKFIQQNLDIFNNKNYEVKKIQPKEYIPTAKGYWHKYCEENSEKSLYPKENIVEDILEHFKEYKPDCEKNFDDIIQNIKNIRDLFYFSEILQGVDNNYNSFPYLTSTTFLGENRNLMDIFDSFSEDKPIRDKLMSGYDLPEINLISYDWFKKNLPNDQKSYILLIQHHFNSTSCTRGHITFLHPDLVKYIYTKSIQMNINKVFSESYHILRKSFENTHLTPLFYYRNRQYLFLDNLFENYWRKNKPFYEEDIQDFNNEFIDFQNRNFFHIASEGEVKLTKESQEELGRNYYYDSKPYEYYTRIKVKEDSRIARNITKFLKFWLRTPVNYIDGSFIFNIIKNIRGDKSIEKNLSENTLISKEILLDDPTENIQKRKTPALLKKSLTSEFNTNEVKITRGGDWKIQGNQSIFRFKVKINNVSMYTITGIHILLTSIPSALNVFSEHHSIKILKPNSYESPSFKFSAKESCVGDLIEGIITYYDHLGKQQTMPIEPFKIEYVCNLLVPKSISKEEFDQKTEFMDEKKLSIESNLQLSQLDSVIEPIIRKCNFALLQDIKTSQSDEYRKIEGFAQGLYDKQNVALTVAIKKIDDGSRLVVKAMSDRSEKVIDILKDFNTKLDNIKSDTQLIIEYTEQIDQILDKVDNLEEYLHVHLASDFEKIKYVWEDYSSGKIKRRVLIGKCIKILGQKFIRIIISNITVLF